MVKIQIQWKSGTGQKPKNVPLTIISVDLNKNSFLMNEKKMVKSQTIVRWRGGGYWDGDIKYFCKGNSAKGWFVFQMSQFQYFFNNS